MAFKTSLTTTRFYTQFDPYFYTTDNRPLTDLDNRDNELADELDRRVSLVDVSGGPTTVVNAAPTGWVVTRNGIGDYTVTHNLNTTSYSVIGTIQSTTPHLLFVYNVSLNSFSLKTVDLTGAVADTHFSCIKTGF